MLLPTSTLLTLLPIIATLDLTSAAAVPADGSPANGRASFFKARSFFRRGDASIKRDESSDAWANFKEFDWSPFENWGFFDHSVEYVKQWYYANYGTNVYPGLDSWQEVSEYVSYFGTAPADLATAPCVTAYTRGMEEAYEYPATRCGSRSAAVETGSSSVAQLPTATDPWITASAATAQPTLITPKVSATPTESTEQGTTGDQSSEYQGESIGSTDNGGYVVPWTNRPSDAAYSFDFGGSTSNDQASSEPTEFSSVFPWDAEQTSDSTAQDESTNDSESTESINEYQGESVGSTESGGSIVPWDNQPEEPSFSFSNDNTATSNNDDVSGAPSSDYVVPSDTQADPDTQASDTGFGTIDLWAPWDQ